METPSTSNLLVCSCGAVSYSDNQFDAKQYNNGICSKNNDGVHNYKSYLEVQLSANPSFQKTEGALRDAPEPEQSPSNEEKEEEEIPEKQLIPKKENKPDIKLSFDDEISHRMNRADKFFSIVLAMYLLIGILTFMVIENFTFVDASYFRTVSLFNVGFGDIIPATNPGKMLNSIFMIIDMTVFVYIYWRIFYFVFSGNNGCKCLNHKYYVIWCIIGLFLLFLSGTLVFCIGEGHTFLDSFVWNFVTISSVGYGHVTPSGVSAKIFCIFYIIFGFLMSLYLTVYLFYTLKLQYFDEPLVINKDKCDDEQIEKAGLLPV